MFDGSGVGVGETSGLGDGVGVGLASGVGDGVGVGSTIVADGLADDSELNSGVTVGVKVGVGVTVGVTDGSGVVVGTIKLPSSLCGFVPGLGPGGLEPL